MAKFTIKDLKEGRCAVYAGGDYNALCKVLKVAFNVEDVYDYDYYYYGLMGKNNKVTMDHSFYCELIPTQKASDFLKEIENPELPKKGDRILVSIDGNYWEKSIFLTYIEGAKDPVICVAKDDEELFKHGDKFGICEWPNWKPIPELEVTLEDIAKKFKVDRIKIVEKKG